MLKVNEKNAKMERFTNRLTRREPRLYRLYRTHPVWLFTCIFVNNHGLPAEEHCAEYRESVLDGLQGMGIVIDKEKNANFKRGEINVISTDDSKVKIYVIPTDEELMIAKDTKRLVK